MASMNKVFLVGNLTRDPDLRYTPAGVAVANFGMAVNRKYKQGEEVKEDVCFVDITVWNRQAETCKEYLLKGSAVLLEGRLSFQSWVTDDGQKRNKLSVVAVNVQFLKTKGAEEEENPPANSPPPQGNNDDDDEDIPF